MAMRCPNCSQEVGREPIRCPRCGYRSELVVEYVWLYAGGFFISLTGFIFGILSTVTVGPPAGHWSRVFVGWFPMGPLPLTYHWLGFLTTGICLTVAGLGITRHRWTALCFFAALLLWELFWTGRKVSSGRPGEPAPFVAGLLLALELLGLLLAVRIARALRRTPPRDVRSLQRRGDALEPDKPKTPPFGL